MARSSKWTSNAIMSKRQRLQRASGPNRAERQTTQEPQPTPRHRPSLAHSRASGGRAAHHHQGPQGFGLGRP
eukprot:13850731-Alexandrium_andersonii.AAC.1